jgi:cytochrome P450
MGDEIFSKKDILDECLAFFGAGTVTGSTTTVSMIMFNMCLPEIRTKIREEIKTVLVDPARASHPGKTDLEIMNAQLNLESMWELKYFTNC